MTILFINCKKTTEKVLDCFSESLLTSVHATLSASNTKQIIAEVRHLGTKKISGIKWEYGNGVTANTTVLTSTYTYPSAGNYTVKARVTFTEGKSSCEVDPTKAVNIQ